MKKRLKVLTAVLGLALVLNACGDPGGAEDRTVLLVSAAASLSDSMERIAAEYERENSGIDIQFNYGSSGTLQKQIEQGAPVDLFLSAGREQMDALARKGLIRESRGVLANRLVLIVHPDAAERVPDLQSLPDSEIRQVAVGEPGTVPAGIYARQALTTLGLWDKLQPKLIYAKDVRQVLSYVETGNAEAGFVYRTDVQEDNDQVKVMLEIDSANHDPIVYPFGVTAGSEHPEEALAFYRYLTTEPALRIFREYGFETL